MRVLFLSYHFPPSPLTGALRAARFARWLPSEIAVEVLTAADPGASALGDRVLVHTVPEPARRVRRGAEALLRHFVWVPDRQLRWARSARRRAEELLATGRFDAVFCSSPPHSAQLVARDLKRHFGVPLVVDFRDPWTEVRSPGWRQRRFDTPLHVWLERRMERSVLRAADAVIANTPRNRDMLLASFPELDPLRVHCIPNGYEPSRPGAIAVARQRAEGFTGRSPRLTGGAPRRCRLLYTGELYDGSERCLEALELLLARDPSLPERIELRLVGSLGRSAARVAARLEQAGLLSLHPRVPFEAVPAELAAADALLYVVPATNAHWVPSKLYDYLVAERPILAIAPRGDAWEILERSGLATLVEDAGTQEVAWGMRHFLSALVSGTSKIEPHADWIARFDGARQAQQLAALLREVASGT